MRNLSFRVPKSSVIKFPCGTGNTKAWADAKDWLLSAMETGESLTPSEVRVLVDFSEWVESVCEKTFAADVVNASFVYFNVNTGLSLVFIAWCPLDDIDPVRYL